MGKAALEGRPGIASVTSGWRGMKEVNTVVYDPARVTINEMESALKKAGTYQGTVEK